MSPLVSILIPCFNSERVVAESIESALAQTYPNIEVIAVDDGSTDHTLDVMRSFGNRIQIQSGPNGGACLARNRAFALSSGEFVQYLDADDLLCPTKIERQIPRLLNGETDIVFCRGFIFGDGKPERPKKREIRDPSGSDPFVYCISQGLSTEGPLIRSSLIKKVGGFQEGLKRGQEWDFHLRLAAAGARIDFLPELLYRHRNDDRPSRITRRKIAPGYITLQMIKLGERLVNEECYDLNGPRKSAFASAITAAGVGCFRGGDPVTAKQAFAFAKELTHPKEIEYPGSRTYQQLCKWFGIELTESALNPIRRIRKLKNRLQTTNE